MTYKENAEKFIETYGLSIGDKIQVNKDDISYTGILLDRPEDADDGYLVLKLSSGYNIGVAIQNTSAELIEKGEKPKIGFGENEIPKDSNKQNISIVSTGGTVSSVIDYRTGAVHPAFTASDLVKANPELLDYANYNVKALYNILSEDMKPEYWVKAAREIANDISNGADGVVIAHGTDTMHYTAAALSFMLKTPVPIILTGAQRSSDRPSSDANINLIDSVVAAKSDIAEVCVCMHGSLNDNYTYLHKGTKVRKMHTSRRDTFRSINAQPIAKIENRKVKFSPDYTYTKRGVNELEVNTDIEEKVGFIKSFPGISSDYIEYHIDKGYKGIVIEGTGLGHVPNELIESFKRARDEHIPVIMTSQCLYGRVNMNVYSTGRNIIDAGVISGIDMTPETTYVKLCWALCQSSNYHEVKEIMHKNIAGEFSEKSSIKDFLN
ncbi:glutamyl-tRNA(Gln) amidotransferase subunit D [Methanobrevibacter gottschalkii]|uniref:Glutamyl-tRNA(Gln) amidotransferase subunit D n=1 Tax=Methanobrevibacter gottschalkii TaxID=190974 RepID=A0A1H7PIN0_9EURY|nr:Glu-tRNA(Gln) amidotransferase subunit GatD [Methanobrevibacter gottschalkii]MCQ2971037.1 Glu-tRNA(Gln) amidotransferase subunit GatD [archaeon]SEL35640.1 glutamyl-tRNA(Gln) amidotransferase subunit D [Methanobrevibacter gottschalkii]